MPFATRHRRIVLTLGDPAGIGPEVMLKALARPTVRGEAAYLLLGDEATVEATRERLGLERFWKTCSPGAPAFGRTPRVLPTAGDPPAPPRPGRWTETTGRASLAWVEEGIRLCLAGEADALVTGPICKAAWKTAGASWPGHTELLAERCGTNRFLMLLVGGDLRVALATIHVPLRAVPALVTRQTVREKGAILAEGLRRDFGLAAPRLAVLGLNPHAGEEGHLGDEEAERIAPAVGDLRAAGIDAAGPLPADTAFHAARRGDYDAILAMYHDQGLGPLKTVAFDTGVNVTLGLPLIRTSVDHGTAFDLAGRGEAEAGSAVAALHLAVRMARLRAGGGEAGGAPSPSGA